MKRAVGLLGWIGVGLVVAAVVLRFTMPARPELYQRLAMGGLAVTLLYALSQWRDVARSFQGRNVKYGSIAASSVLLVLAILVGANYVSNRRNVRWDLTEGGQFSLSDQTKQILTNLDQPVVIRVFYRNNADEYRDRLNEYTYVSDRVSAVYIDADRNPLDAQKYDITTLPTFVVEYAGRTERATAADEQTLTNALKKVVEGKPKKVYFVQGHGEHDPDDSTPAGFSVIADAMKGDNFETAKLTLAQTGTVPDDATVVVVAGPRTDLLAAETEALRAFLARGGKVQLLIDPPDKGSAAPLTNLLALAREWGVEVGNNIVVDASGLGQLIGTDASVPVAMPVSHPITRNFGVMSAFPLARSVKPIEGGSQGRIAQQVLETSPQSWGESDMAGLYSTGRPARDANDMPGPVPIAAAVAAAANGAPAPTTPDAPKPESRVVVVGDSDFASNRAVGIQGNREIFLNMANWLAEQEDLIAIRPRDPQDRPVTLTADKQQSVFWLTMAIVPLLLFGNAVRVFWRRR